MRRGEGRVCEQFRACRTTPILTPTPRHAAPADLKKAYKRGDGMRIDGRRILVDVERGRTVKGEAGGRLQVIARQLRPNQPPAPQAGDRGASAAASAPRAPS